MGDFKACVYQLLYCGFCTFVGGVIFLSIKNYSWIGLLWYLVLGTQRLGIVGIPEASRLPSRFSDISLTSYSAIRLSNRVQIYPGSLEVFVVLDRADHYTQVCRVGLSIVQH